jgi:hypothetical protein
LWSRTIKQATNSSIDQGGGAAMAYAFNGEIISASLAEVRLRKPHPQQQRGRIVELHRMILRTAGIMTPARLHSSFGRPIANGPSGDRMSALPIGYYFNAAFPGAALSVKITSLNDAKVFARRWVIRDKDPALKTLLLHLERANSSATADIAIRQLKQALAYRGMLVTVSPLLNDFPQTT